MQLSATLTRDDLSSVLEEITPLRIQVRPRRVITLGRPTKVELVAGVGLRVRGDARFTWDIGGLVIPVTLQSWQILLVPSFVARKGRHVLAFAPVLEDLDFKRVPMFLDGRIADAVKQGLAAQKHKLAWDFAKHLSLLHPMPKQMRPRGDLTLAPTGGTIVVTASEVRLTLSFALSIARESPSGSPRAVTAHAATAR